MYIVMVFIPIPGLYPLFFGVGTGLIMRRMAFIFPGWVGEHGHPHKIENAGIDSRLVGYFLFDTATYNLCPLMGAKAVELYPEEMNQYHLQSEAAAFAVRNMIGIVLEWLIIFLSYRRKFKFGMEE